MSFEPFPKMARLFRDCVMSEKIDGSNAQIMIADTNGPVAIDDENAVIVLGDYAIYAGSRSRWLQPMKSADNFGFARWVVDHAAELVKLGVGRHYGEWWGSGINRGYGLPKDEKRFSLFNVARWSDDAVRPACCYVVPTLYSGTFSTDTLRAVMHGLRKHGSVAAWGFMDPEGVVTWHEASRTLFKTTLKNDEAPKGLAA